MPFGLATAPSVYSRFIQAILNPLGTAGLQAYLDDILLYHNGVREHLDRLEQVFQAHREGGIRLKPSKTQLFREEINYLGHTLSREGVAMQADYIARIMDWPAPQSPKELNTLLGFLGYYRRFIPEFSVLTAEMNAQKTAKVLDCSVKRRLWGSTKPPPLNLTLTPELKGRVNPPPETVTIGARCGMDV